MLQPNIFAHDQIRLKFLSPHVISLHAFVYVSI